MNRISYQTQLDSVNQNIDLAISMISTAGQDPLNGEGHLQNAIAILQQQKATIHVVSEEMDMEAE